MTRLPAPTFPWPPLPSSELSPTPTHLHVVALLVQACSSSCDWASPRLDMPWSSIYTSSVSTLPIKKHRGTVCLRQDFAPATQLDSCHLAAPFTDLCPQFQGRHPILPKSLCPPQRCAIAISPRLADGYNRVPDESFILSRRTQTGIQGWDRRMKELPGRSVTDLA